MNRLVLSVVCLASLAACGGNDNAAANVAQGAGVPAPATPGAIDFTSPESVYAAYSAAADLGDKAAIDAVSLPTQRGQWQPLGTVSVNQRGYTLVRREDRSATEVHLHVVLKWWSESPCPQVLVLHEGKWYVDIQQTRLAMVRAKSG